MIILPQKSLGRRGGKKIVSESPHPRWATFSRAGAVLSEAFATSQSQLWILANIFTTSREYWRTYSRRNLRPCTIRREYRRRNSRPNSRLVAHFIVKLFQVPKRSISRACRFGILCMQCNLHDRAHDRTNLYYISVFHKPLYSNLKYFNF